MVESGQFTPPSPADSATLALHADGVLQLIMAADTGAVSGGRESLQLLLVEMKQLSSHALDINRMRTEPYVADPAMTEFEFFIRVSIPCTPCTVPCLSVYLRSIPHLTHILGPY